MAKATQTTRKTTTNKKTTASWSLSKAMSNLTGGSSASKVKKNSSNKSTGRKRCPTCGKFMGNGGSR